MCHYLAKLAEIDPWRFITCCEHGNMHLHWEKVRFTFTYGEFVHLLTALEAQQYDMPGTIQDVYEWSHWLENQRFRVNIETTALTLDAAELALLVKAMVVALARLGEDSDPAGYAQRAYRRRITPPLHPPGYLSSKN